MVVRHGFIVRRFLGSRGGDGFGGVVVIVGFSGCFGGGFSLLGGFGSIAAGGERQHGRDCGNQNSLLYQ